MQTNNYKALQLQIAALKKTQEQQLDALHDQLNETYQSLRPINLIKNTLLESAASPTIRQQVFNNLLGIASGYIANNLILGKPKNAVSRIFGSILQFVVAKAVVNTTTASTVEKEK
jgi:hypothetical protein